MIKRSLILGILISLVWGSVCFGHGMHHTVLNRGIGIEATYDDKTPVSYSKAKVFSPLVSERPFQEGLTDKNGRFIFYPDVTGVWRITVDDDIGHLLKVNINVESALTVKKENITSLSRFQGVVVGISVIFGVFGIVSICYRRKHSGGKER